MTRRVRCSRCCLGACRAPTFGLMAASDRSEASNFVEDCRTCLTRVQLRVAPVKPRFFLTGWNFHLGCYCQSDTSNFMNFMLLYAFVCCPTGTLAYTGQWQNNRMHGKHGVQDLAFQCNKMPSLTCLLPGRDWRFTCKILQVRSVFRIFSHKRFWNSTRIRLNDVHIYTGMYMHIRSYKCQDDIVYLRFFFHRYFNIMQFITIHNVCVFLRLRLAAKVLSRGLTEEPGHSVSCWFLVVPVTSSSLLPFAGVVFSSYWLRFKSLSRLQFSSACPASLSWGWGDKCMYFCLRCIYYFRLSLFATLLLHRLGLPGY